jgi:broad-specificity NMP kinase
MNILIVGPSGSGKSTIGRLLRQHGYNFIEADTNKYKGRSIAYFRNKKTGEGVDMPWPRPEHWQDENDWVWRVELIKSQLADWDDQFNFVCGDAYNKREAYHLFDKIFVLSTDDGTLKQRVEAREDNYFGKIAEQLAWIVSENNQLVAEAKHANAIIIDATKSPEEITELILKYLG